MKVLLVVHGFPPNAQGGTEIYASAHAHMLAERFGDTVLVIARESDTSRPEYALRFETQGRLRVAWINNTFRLTKRFEESYSNDAITRAAAQIIDDFRPDLAHIHHLTGVSTGIVPELARRGIPIFLTLHDYWLMCHRGQMLNERYERCSEAARGGCGECVSAAATLPSRMTALAPIWRSVERRLPHAGARVWRRASDLVIRSVSSESSPHYSDEARLRAAQQRAAHMRSVLQHVTRFFAPSRFMRDRFVEFGAPGEAVIVAGLGIDSRQSPVASRQSRFPDGPLRLGFIGTLMASKAPHLLVDACRSFLASRVRIELFGSYTPYHGDDSYRDVITSRLSQAGVHHHGPAAHGEIPRILSTLDAVVMPSVWEENSPLVIHEAFAAGVPVVASRVGGIPELVDDGVNGLLFGPGDAASLRHAIERLLDEPALLERLRSGIPRVRTIDEDVAFTRAAYCNELARPPRPTPRRRIAAVVLNHRTAADTRIAIQRLASSARPLDATIVVDNDSQRDCAAACAGVSAEYLWTGTNLGFSGGMNVGIRAALERGAEAIFILNSDVVLPRDCVGTLEEVLFSDSGIGIVGPLVVSRSAPDRVASAGIAWNRRTGRMKQKGVGDASASWQSRATVDADAVSGCAMLVRRGVFARGGLFDEDYFFGFEDLDLCLRARRAGYRVLLVTGASVFHQGGRSLPQASARRLYFATRNHLRVAGVSQPDASRAAHAARSAAILALNVAHAVRSRGEPLPARLGAVARGVRDHLRGRYGDPAD